MKPVFKVFFSLLVTFGSNFLPLPGQITFVNGDFEINSSSACNYNMGNATFTSLMNAATAYGPGQELDIMSSCPYGAPQNGSWFVSLALPGGNPDAFTLQLSAPLVSGNAYSICFYDRGFSNGSCCPPGTPMQVGISTSPSSQGTVVFTGPTPTLNTWSQRTFNFIAPNNGQHVSFQTTGSGRWTHIDNVSLTNCGVFPAELIYFKAQNGPNKPATLSWASATEQNLAYYILERSLDGDLFDPVDTVQATGRISAESHYGSTDHEPIVQEVFYKLRMMDVDGIAYHSDIVSLKAEADQPKILIYPNPTAGQLNVRLTQGILATVGDRIEVYNSLGSKVLDQPLQAENELDLSRQSAGVYLVVVNAAGQKIRKSVVLR